jgi:short-subunit dehydrogenase
MNTHHVLITGACSGLGRAFVQECAQRGMHLILIDQPGMNVAYLAKNIQMQYEVPVNTFECDLTDTLDMHQQLQYISEHFEVSFIINNAGIGGTAAITDTSIERIDRIISLNIRSMALLTRILLPKLQEHPKAYILNVSSMAAFTPIAYKSVYPASKAFIASFSLGLKQELQATGISVSVLYPGPIMTNSDVSRRIIGLGAKGKVGLLSADAIANRAIRDTLAGRPAIIPGRMNRMNHLLMRLLPARLKTRVVSREMSKELQFT